jgi:hypothetical protein
LRKDARSLLAADNNDGTLGGEERDENWGLARELPFNAVISANEVADGRQLKLRVAALRFLDRICVTAPLHGIAIAISHKYPPR